MRLDNASIHRSLPFKIALSFNEHAQIADIAPFFGAGCLCGGFEVFGDRWHFQRILPT
jgi:hypothetical protein